ncbi:hypothetical protein LZ575_07490 [Antarcticibacterium sp. 1MA-6-2]|uniref:hypothetical protein n=1 Tax=Antarcticibacterium sp. 1MA-6-2 TaxID=2908210 RepID=UPI001F1D5D7B|nr:hypothetical protein [Antarcticibacterium sp. 1MA-6-2]UJH92361.1 hypothetical protein LZ575_07490 [Antarcticibacterium sp. 1MA-6-2]
MKELKVILLVFAIGFGSTVPATTKFQNPYYPNTIKGGLQTTKNNESAKIAGLGVEGDYEYYLQYVKYKLDYKKNQGEHDAKKAILSPSCVLADTLEISC